MHHMIMTFLHASHDNVSLWAHGAGRSSLQSVSGQKESERVSVFVCVCVCVCMFERERARARERERECGMCINVYV